MRSDRRNLTRMLLPAVALLYAAAAVIFFIIAPGSFLIQFNTYLTAAVSLLAAVYVMSRAIRENNRGAMLYAGLGMCCLVLGNLNFVLLDLVSYQYDEISVGLFAKVCCYLFFIAALTAARKRGRSGWLIVINVISLAATVACVYAVITNGYLTINLSVMLLDVLCAVLAVNVLRKGSADVRFFALVMLLLSIKSFLSAFAILSFATDTFAPVLYLLFAQAAGRMKEGAYAD